MFKFPDSARFKESVSKSFDVIQSGAYEDEEANSVIESSSKFSKTYCSSREKGYSPDESIRFALSRLKDVSLISPKQIKLLDPSLLKGNPCFKAYRKVKGCQDGSLCFVWLCYKKGEVFVMDEKEVKGFQDKERLGYFDEDVSFPAILDGDVPWMSIIPHEILSMKGPLEKAKGTVVTYGLGLGYFAFMASIKDEVKDVYIVENDPSAIEVFKKHLLPSFPNQEKIHIIEGDALRKDILKEVPEKVDFVFADLYHNADDALLMYPTLLRNEVEGVEYSYWIENSILLYFRRFLAAYLYERAVEGYEDDAYQSADSYDDRIMASLHKALSKDEIKDPKDIESFLGFEMCKKICKKMIIEGRD